MSSTGSSTPLRLLSVSDPTSIQHPNSDPVAPGPPAQLTLISLLTTPPLMATPHHHAHPPTSSPRRPTPPIYTPSLSSLSPSICKAASLSCQHPQFPCSLPSCLTLLAKTSAMEGSNWPSSPHPPWSAEYLLHRETRRHRAGVSSHPATKPLTCM